MKGDSIVMHPILSKASLREPDTERLNTMLAENTGKSYDEVVRATERDNFLTPEQALEFGIIDRVLVSRSDMTEKN